GVAYVPVRAAHDEAWRRHLRDRRPPRPDELDEGPDDRCQPCRDQDPASRLGDHPPGHGRVEVPITKQVREQQAEGAAESYAPGHTHGNRPKSAHLAGWCGPTAMGSPHSATFMATGCGNGGRGVASTSKRGVRRCIHAGSHQLAVPRSCMTAGTSIIRTTVASTSTATARPRPNTSRIRSGSPITNDAKTHTMMAAAAVMIRALLTSP